MFKTSADCHIPVLCGHATNIKVSIFLIISYSLAEILAVEAYTNLPLFFEALTYKKLPIYTTIKGNVYLISQEWDTTGQIKSGQKAKL